MLLYKPNRLQKDREEDAGSLKKKKKRNYALHVTEQCTITSCSPRALYPFLGVYDNSMKISSQANAEGLNPS